MTSASLLRMMTVTATTKRSDVSGGKRGAATTKLIGVKTTPLDPAGRDIYERAGTGGPVVMLETWTAGGQDIVAGDILTVSTVDYPIKIVDIIDASTNGGDAYLRLGLERIKP
jgi:hypothetical protein